jgi:hypothetical protein
MQPVTLIDIKSVNASLASEVMWFINEWCKETGWSDPRMKNNSEGGFLIYATPPARHEQPGASITPAV